MQAVQLADLNNRYGQLWPPPENEKLLAQWFQVFDSSRADPSPKKNFRAKEQVRNVREQLKILADTDGKGDGDWRDVARNVRARYEFEKAVIEELRAKVPQLEE